MDNKIELVVRSIERTEKETKKLDVEKVKVTAKDAEGKFSVSFEGPKGSFQGIKADTPIIVTITRSQKTIQESTEKPAKKK
jgi:hypothetical protein